MGLFTKKKKSNTALIIASIVGGVVVLTTVTLKVINFLRMFKKNADEFLMFKKAELDYSGELFEDECISVVSSKVKINLVDAVASNNPMNLCLKSKLSKVDVVVPEGWNVKVQGNTIKSSIINEVTFDKENFEAPLLFVNYVSESSHVRIKTAKPYIEMELEVDDVE